MASEERFDWFRREEPWGKARLELRKGVDEEMTIRLKTFRGDNDGRPFRR
jgi:hypothetical protein